MTMPFSGWNNNEQVLGHAWAKAETPNIARKVMTVFFSLFGKRPLFGRLLLFFAFDLRSFIRQQKRAWDSGRTTFCCVKPLLG